MFCLIWLCMLLHPVFAQRYTISGYINPVDGIKQTFFENL